MYQLLSKTSLESHAALFSHFIKLLFSKCWKVQCQFFFFSFCISFFLSCLFFPLKATKSIWFMKFRSPKVTQEQ